MRARVGVLVGAAAVFACASLVAIVPANAATTARMKVVQRVSATTGHGTAGSLGLTFPTATLGHSLLVLVVTTSGGVADSAGNLWVKAVSTGFNGFMETEFWYSRDSAPATSLTITWATFTGSTVMDAYEVSGADRLEPLAGHSGGTQSVAAFSCESSIDPGPPDYLAIGLVSGNEKQPIAVGGGYKAAKQLTSRTTTMHSAYLVPANGLSTLSGSWANEMACSGLVVAFKTR